VRKERAERYNPPMHPYQERLAARQRELGRLERADARLAFARLGAVGLTILVAVLSFRFELLSAWSLVLPVLAFLALAIRHDRVLRAKRAAATACVFYEHGIARMEDRWIGNGNKGERFVDEHHPYANDLDLFGAGSLFELLSLARTHVGEDTLAAFLKWSDAGMVRPRQQAVAELREQLDFREAMATAGSDGKDIGELDTAALGAWMEHTPAAISPAVQLATIPLAIAIVLTLWWWAIDGPITPLVLVLLIKATFTRVLHKRVARVLEGPPSIEGPMRQLDILSDALTQIEQLQVTSPRLAALRGELLAGGMLPSRAIRHLQRLADMLDWQRNAFFAPIGATLSWSTHIAASIERWRRRFGARVPGWLNILGEHEALNSLAAYAYEHPADPFPALIENAPGAVFDGTQLGHPLVAAAHMVRNDVKLSPDVRLLIVSGSNMSGKSTLLRTVGINAVMAMAGAPVRAERLALTPLSIGATLHVQDSLQAGRSRFFTEITRVRQISDLAGRQPQLLFLLDELFQGTNSHDRKVGATALLRSLVARGAIGLITTHDLALTAIAGELGGRALNVHFQDEFRGNEMVFDYRMRPGPVAHGNALALMRAVGLSGLDDPQPDLETLQGPVAEKPHMADKRQYE
jgi:hypothetical protein